MQFSKPHTLAEIAAILNCKFIGNSAFLIKGMNEIHRIKEGEIVFVDHPKYYDKALQSAASVILINKEVPCPEGKALLISSDPFRDFNFLINFFRPFEFNTDKVSNSAQIGSNCQIHSTVTLGNNVKIEANCHIINTEIADNTTILANSIIENSKIGSGVNIGPFARIRPNTTLGNTTKIGNFVEVKKSSLKGVKAGHLSYLGDSQIDEGTNIGAGTITCNYDGINKHKTI